MHLLFSRTYAARVSPHGDGRVGLELGDAGRGQGGADRVQRGLAGDDAVGEGGHGPLVVGRVDHPALGQAVRVAIVKRVLPARLHRVRRAAVDVGRVVDNLVAQQLRVVGRLRQDDRRHGGYRVALRVRRAVQQLVGFRIRHVGQFVGHCAVAQDGPGLLRLPVPRRRVEGVLARRRYGRLCCRGQRQHAGQQRGEDGHCLGGERGRERERDGWI